MKRRNVVTVIIVIVILVVLITLAINRIHNYTCIDDVEWVEYVVQPGDTLWGIARHNNNYDTRVLVDAIKTHNNINEYIIPYTVIEIPVED